MSKRASSCLLVHPNPPKKPADFEEDPKYDELYKECAEKMKL